MNHDDFLISGLRKLNPEILGLKIVPGLECSLVPISDSAN